MVSKWVTEGIFHNLVEVVVLSLILWSLIYAELLEMFSKDKKKVDIQMRVGWGWLDGDDWM